MNLRQRATLFPAFGNAKAIGWRRIVVVARTVVAEVRGALMVVEQRV